jgi:hypothetical protein
MMIESGAEPEEAGGASDEATLANMEEGPGALDEGRSIQGGRPAAARWAVCVLSIDHLAILPLG